MINKSTVRRFLMLGAALGIVACGNEPYGEDHTTDSTSAALQRAVPKKDWFRIELGVSLGAPQVSTGNVSTLDAKPADACKSAEPAQFSILSKKISSDANGTLAGILGTVEAITANPPLAASPTHAVWGPIASPTSVGVYKLDVERRDERVFSFLLSGRPKDGDESSWMGIFEGTVASPDDDHRAGDAHVDFAHAHALDGGGGPETGGLALHFEAEGTKRVVELTFGGVTGPGSPEPNDAFYRYAQVDDATGTFDFTTRTDFDGDGAANELVNVKSRWIGGVGGQAAVTILSEKLAHPVTATQCWNGDNALVFYADDATVHPPAGSPACCPK